MKLAQMDQMEQVHVSVVQVIQLRQVLLIVLFVLMVMSWRVRIVLNAILLVKLVVSIQLIVLRNTSFIFFLLLFVSQTFFFKKNRCKSGLIFQEDNTCRSNCSEGTYYSETCKGIDSIHFSFFLILTPIFFNKSINQNENKRLFRKLFNLLWRKW